MRNVERLFKIMVLQNATEMQVADGKPVMLRIGGVLRALQTPPLTEEHIRSVFCEIMTPLQKEAMRWEANYQFTHEFEGKWRIHITISHGHGCMSAVCQLADGNMGAGQPAHT